jgi:transcriptional regulator with XRE-family HTH domain
MAKNKFDIKDEIASRIVAARKAANLTIADIQEKTNQKYSYSRIYNWESARRMPGVEEILVLAGLLNISPSYLLCLSDEPKLSVSVDKAKSLFSVPILSWDKVMESREITDLSSKGKNSSQQMIFLDADYRPSIGSFALKLRDNSMAPRFQKGDVIVFDPNVSPEPTDFVLAYDKAKSELIFREYRANGVNENKNQVFDLLPMNLKFVPVPNVTSAKFKIVGRMLESRHYNYMEN